MTKKLFLLKNNEKQNKNNTPKCVIRKEIKNLYENLKFARDDAFYFFFFFVGKLADGQILAFKHSPHFGPIGLQICCPKPTRSKLISDHNSAGNQASKPTLVPSGFLVGFSTHWRRFAMRCTWVSTPAYKRYIFTKLKKKKFRSKTIRWGESRKSPKNSWFWLYCFLYDELELFIKNIKFVWLWENNITILKEKAIQEKGAKRVLVWMFYRFYFVLQSWIKLFYLGFIELQLLRAHSKIFFHGSEYYEQRIVEEMESLGIVKLCNWKKVMEWKRMLKIVTGRKQNSY